MIRRAPDRFDRNVFWNYLRARRPTPDEFVMDLADQEGIDETNRAEWNRTVNKILDWVSDEQARDDHGKGVGIIMYNVAGAAARLNFLPLMRRIMARPDFDPLFYLVALREAAAHGSLDVLRLVLERDTTPNQNNMALYDAARLGQADVVRILLRDGRFDPTIRGGKIIVSAAKRGHTEVVKVLLADPRIDPAVFNNDAIRVAAIENHPDVVRVLLADPRVNPTELDHEAVRSAVLGKHVDVLRLLLADPRVDPSYSGNEVLLQLEPPAEIAQMFLAHPRIHLSNEMLYDYVASEWPVSTEIVRLLLRDGRIDPTEEDSRVLRGAAEYGKDEIMQALLDDWRVDPNFGDGKPLYWATKFNHHETVRVLLSDPRVDPRAHGHAAFKRALRDNLEEVVREFLRDGRVNPFENATLIRRILKTPHKRYRKMLRILLEDPRAKRVFSKEDAQDVLDSRPDMITSFVVVLNDYIREIQRGQPLDDSEPPTKMIKDPLWN